MIAIVVVLLALGWGIVQLVALPFGGIGTGVSVFWGFLLVAVVLGVMAFIGTAPPEARPRAAPRSSARTCSAGKRPG